MLNPILAQEHVRAHQAELAREAEGNRLARQATADQLTPTDALRSRLSDLLLASALKLKRLDAPTGFQAAYHVTAGPPSPAVGALVPAQAAAHPRPTFGFSLLRYGSLPAVGLMYWRLDTLGARGATAGGYLTLTWLAE
jgi:hypothetical protein